MSQVRKLNENSNRRYQFYDRRIKNLLRKIHTDSREKPETKNTSEVSWFSTPAHKHLNPCGNYFSGLEMNVDMCVKSKHTRVIIMINVVTLIHLKCV